MMVRNFGLSSRTAHDGGAVTQSGSLGARAQGSLDRLRQFLTYDPSSGIFTWKKKTSARVAVGDVAGSATDRGYIHLQIEGTKYSAHRLAWLFSFGVWPTDLDHKDRDTGNNRLSNLREASPTQNAQNRARKGCWFEKRRGKYRAQIIVDKRFISLGYFADEASAQAAYEAASLRYFGEFSAYHGENP